MKKSALIGTALLSAATVAAGIVMIALPHAYASWEWRGYRGDLNHDGVVSMVDIVKMQRIFAPNWTPYRVRTSYSVLTSTKTTLST